MINATHDPHARFCPHCYGGGITVYQPEPSTGPSSPLRSTVPHAPDGSWLGGRDTRTSADPLGGRTALPAPTTPDDRAAVALGLALFAALLAIGGAVGFVLARLTQQAATNVQSVAAE